VKHRIVAPIRELAARTRKLWVRWRLPLAGFLGVGFGGLMLIAVSGVLLLSLAGARQNTTELLRSRVDLTIQSVEDRLRSLLDPVIEQTDFIRSMIEEGRVDPDDPKALEDLFLGALAATPQVSGMAYIRADYQVTRVSRTEKRAVVSDWSDRTEIVANMAEVRRGVTNLWSPPVWSKTIRETILYRNVPVMGPNGFRGVLVPTIRLARLSAFLARFGEAMPQTAFILYDHDRVLAHPGMQDDMPGLSLERPLPGLDQVGDPVLARMWGPQRRPLGLLGGLPVSAHRIELETGDFVFLYRELTGYGTVPWTIGVHLPGAVLGAEVDRLKRMTAVGIAASGLAVLAAILFGRRMGRPLMRFAAAAEGVRRLDLIAVPRLRRSRVRELDEAVLAFNAMVTGLRWFEMYLPKLLVHRLVAEGRTPVPMSEERTVTVMFTDVVGYSRLASGMAPVQAAGFINAHFGLIGACIEAEQGIIDKFIGDSVMAFWGAPDEQPDHAACACRAARAITAAVRADNEHRQNRGEPPILVRIGIHSGPVLVGNIGSPGRINFTLVGDVVNAAERIEQLGKDVTREDDVTVLVTGATATHLGTAFTLRDEGVRQMRGRDDPIRVYRLLGPI
jgi:adenylate cyclase